MNVGAEEESNNQIVSSIEREHVGNDVRRRERAATCTSIACLFGKRHEHIFDVACSWCDDALAFLLTHA